MCVRGLRLGGLGELFNLARSTYGDELDVPAGVCEREMKPSGIFLRSEISSSMSSADLSTTLNDKLPRLPILPP